MKGSTPLHYAVFTHSEEVLTYILAWEPLLNVQDLEGDTPLHLAVKAADQSYSTRILAALLAAGIDKTIRNKKEQTAMDMAKEISDKRTRENTVRMLGKPSKLACLMLRIEPHLQETKQPTVLIIQVAIQVACISLMYIFVLH